MLSVIKSPTISIILNTAGNANHFCIKAVLFSVKIWLQALTQKNFFEKRRKNAYLGSRSHFFTSLWTNSLRSNGFIVKNSIGKMLGYDDIVIVRDGYKKYLSYKDNLYIYYLFKSSEQFY